MKNAITLLGILLLAGCSTSGPQQRVAKGTMVSISVVSAPDILHSDSLSTSTIASLNNRIEKYLAKRLDDKGVPHGPDGTAKVVVALTTIEEHAGTTPGPFFSTLATRDMRAKYTGTLTSQDGVILQFADDRNDESMDKLAERIGNDVGNRVASRCR